jgi:hypothetical protein
MDKQERLKGVIRDNPIKYTNFKSDEDFLRDATVKAIQANTAWKENYEQAREDSLFVFGEQWNYEDKRKRDKEGRVTLTLNKMQQFINRVTGDQRQNVQQITVSPIDGNNLKATIPNTAGTKDYPLSDIYESLIRNIEQQSQSSAHYKTAFQHSVEGGFGWLRVLTDYSRNDQFDLDLKIECIRDRFSVSIDPTATQPDYSDANYCFIHSVISRDEFEKRYPKADIGDIERLGREEYSYWILEDRVRVSEYFVREAITKTLVLMSDGETHFKEDIESVLDELANMGVTVIRERKVKTYKVMWYKITANSILDKTEWVGSTIPIIPVLGRELNIDGRRFYTGLIADAKDGQRMLNYWQSASTERVGLSPKAPWIGSTKNFEGLDHIWSQANLTNFSYLPYNSTPNGDKPFRLDPPQTPTAEMALAQQMEGGIQSSIGIYNASLGNSGQETSGRAINARQSQSDTGTFLFQDNMNLAIARVGKILIECIPKVYDANRVIRIKNQDDSGDFVEINKTIVDQQTGQEVIINDLGVGKFDIVVSTGVSYSTQRQESAEKMLDFTRAVPQSAEVAPDLIARNLDFPNAEALADRLKKLIPSNLLSPEEQEELAKEAPPQEPTPQEQLEAQKAQLELELAQAKVELERAKVAKEQQQGGEKGVSGQEVQQMIIETISQLLAKQGGKNGK